MLTILNVNHCKQMIKNPKKGEPVKFKNYKKKIKSPYDLSRF